MWRSSITDKQALINEAKFSILHLKQLYTDLVSNKIVNSSNEDIVIEILRELAEMVVYGDNKSDILFDFFCEKNMLSLFLEIMWVDNCPNTIHIQILQTLSILIKCVKNNTSLYYLLSNNYINEVIIFPYNIDNDESLRDQFASFMKSLSLRLDNQTVQFFFIEDTGAFPILNKAIDMLKISEPMVRTASQATILNVYKVDDKKARPYALQDQVMNCFFIQIVTLFEGHYMTLLALCQEQLKFNNHSYNIDIDDDIALKNFTNHISDLFNSIQDWFYYLSDVYELDIAKLQIALTVHLMSEFIIPTLLSPLCKYASLLESAIPSEGSEEKVSNEEKTDNNTDNLALHIIVSLTFLNQLLRIIQDKLLHRVIMIMLFHNDPDEWKKLVEVLLLQCDNHTTCVDIIAMVSDGIDDNNINPDNKNLYRICCLSLFKNPNKQLSLLALTVVNKLMDSLISNIWYKEEKVTLAQNICKFFDTINMNEIIEAMCDGILKDTTMHTLSTIQICSFTIYSYIRILHASQISSKNMENIRNKIRDAGRNVSKSLLQILQQENNAETIIHMLQQEISRLHGQRWTNIVTQIIQEISLFSSSKPIGSPNITEADTIPISQSEISRKELQVFILLYSLIRHIVRLCLSISEVSTGDDLSLHLIDEILKIYNESGVAGRGYSEGQTFEMKGRRFLDAYFIDGARSPQKNNSSSSETSSTSISSMFGFSSQMLSKTTSPASDTISPGSGRRRSSFGSKTSPPTTKPPKGNFGEILFVQNNYQLLLVSPETVGFSVVIVAPLLLSDGVIDTRDKRQLKILVRSWDHSVSYMTRVGAGDRDSEFGEDNDNMRGSFTQSSVCLLKPRVQRNLWELTIAFETTQGCYLAVQHLTSKKESLLNEVKQHLTNLLNIWSER